MEVNYMRKLKIFMDSNEKLDLYLQALLENEKLNKKIEEIEKQIKNEKYNVTGKVKIDKSKPLAPKEIVINPQGYVVVRMSGHPRSTKHKRVLQHVLVMEQKLGRPIERHEIIHHIDGNKSNNDPDNLMILNSSEHAKLHARERKERRDNERNMKKNG